MTRRSDRSKPKSDRPLPAPADTNPPWAFKHFPPEERNAALAAAKRASVPISQWIALAVRRQIQWEREQERSPAVIPLPDPVRPEGQGALFPPPTFDEVERLATMARELAEANSTPLPPSILRLLHRNMRERLKAGVPVRRKVRTE